MSVNRLTAGSTMNRIALPLVIVAVVAVAVACAGCGGSPTAPSVSPANSPMIRLSGDLTFGSISVGSTATANLTIDNTGTSPLTVSAITYPAGFSGNWTTGQIAPGTSHIVVVTFAPTSAGAYKGPLTVRSDATGGATAMDVSGEGTMATRAPDAIPPTFVSVSFSPSTVDVTSGSAKTTVSAHITDVGTGVRAASLRVFLTGPSGVLLNCDWQTLVSGTANDGTCTCEIAIPAASAAGAWRFTSADVRDNAENVALVSDAAAAQLSAGITVAGAR
jgi:uncharacterized membrane protein